ncbi:MAG TPA: prepilin peptidase [Candidatus Omnitrophota bacterium]|nr:prepilin peptidase [Candidatus Omnitrophota bacterium]
MLDIMIPVFVFLTGICIGSFLNVCIYRMGREQSVVRPGSHCPKCNKPIRPKDNIPLVSYILLKGRCRDCGVKISPRYFFVEFLTGIVFLVMYHAFGLTVQGFAYTVMISGLIVATFVDFDFRIIPDEISIGGMVLGLILSFIFPIQIQHVAGHFRGLFHSLLGVLVGGGVLWILGIVGDFLFKKESMGGGDIKLLAMIGAFLGWQTALLILPISSLIGAVVGVIIKIRTKESLIAFGPYLAMAAVICIFWKKEILSYFLLA